MALIQPSALINNMAGSVGKLVFQGTVAGLVCRIQYNPTKPISPSQLLQQAGLATIAELWKTAVMQPYRSAWIVLANAHPYTDPFGVTHKLTGLAFFTKLNRNLQTLNLSSILVAPGTLACGNPISISAAYTGGGSPTLIVTPSNAPASTEAVVIRTTRPLSPGISRIGMTQTIITTFPAPSAPPWDIYTPFNAKHPVANTTSGQQLFIIVNYVETSTGFAGTEIIYQLTWP